MESFPTSSSTPSPLYMPKPVPTSSPATIGTSLALSPTPPTSSASGDNPDSHVFILSDDNGSVYTTTVYSTQDIPSSLNSTPADIHQTGQPVPNLAAIIAGVGGGVGLLLLLVGVIWYVGNKRAKRHARTTLIKDRKFYPDRYNQTVTSTRHSQLNEADPGPVMVQPPPLPRYPSSLSSGPLSRQTSLYQSHVASPVIHENWIGAPPTDRFLEDTLARHRVPYPSSPVQPQVDRYTMLKSRTTSISNSPDPLRLPLNPPPKHPRTFRSPSANHRRYHSHQSYHNPPHYQGHGFEQDSYFTPIPTPHPSPPVQLQVARRYTVFVSPPMSPSSLSALSSPLRDPQIPKAVLATVALTNRPSVARCAFSSADSLIAPNNPVTTKRMMVTNPDSDADLETDTDTEGLSGSGCGGSPSATDIIRLYGRDQDQDTSPESSILKDKDSHTAPVNPIPMLTRNS